MLSRKFVAGLLVSFLGGASLVTVGVQMASTATPAPVQAASTVEIGDTVYLELNSSYWGQAAAYYTIHYWGGTTSSTWPGVNFNSNASATGNTVITATWDPTSIHCIILRWSDSSHSTETEWNRWNHFDSNSFTAGQYNYFANTDWSTAASSLVQHSTGDVYYGNSGSWSDVYVYSWNSAHSLIGKSNGTWPGTKFTSVSANATFDSASLYKASFASSLDNMIIFNDGTGATAGTDKTNDLSLLLDGYYKLNYATTGDTDRGAAAAFIYDLNAKRIAASYGSLSGSICGISSADATSLVNSYKGLGATSKGYVDADTSYIYTYTNTSSTQADKNVSISSIMSELSSISGVALSAHILSNSSNTSTMTLVVALSAFVALGTVGLFFILHKKKALK